VETTAVSDMMHCSIVHIYTLLYCAHIALQHYESVVQVVHTYTYVSVDIRGELPKRVKHKAQ